MKYSLGITIDASPVDVIGDPNAPAPTVRRMNAMVNSDSKEGCQAGLEDAWRIVMNRRCWIREIMEPKAETDFNTRETKWRGYLRMSFIDEEGWREMMSQSTEQVIMGGLPTLRDQGK